MATAENVLKNWPGDAIVIICARPEEFRHDLIRGIPVDQECRDCGCSLKADSFTIETAEKMPIRFGRALRFLCVPCASRYNIDECHHVEDHRGGKTTILKSKPPIRAN